MDKKGSRDRNKLPRSNEIKLNGKRGIDLCEYLAKASL